MPARWEGAQCPLIPSRPLWGDGSSLSEAYVSQQLLSDSNGQAAVRAGPSLGLVREATWAVGAGVWLCRRASLSYPGLCSQVGVSRGQWLQPRCAQLPAASGEVAFGPLKALSCRSAVILHLRFRNGQAADLLQPGKAELVILCY